jgi:hypothetical protein
MEVPPSVVVTDKITLKSFPFVPVRLVEPGPSRARQAFALENNRPPRRRDHRTSQKKHPLFHLRLIPPITPPRWTYGTTAATEPVSSSTPPPPIPPPRRISQALDVTPEGLSRVQIRALFHRHVSKDRIDLISRSRPLWRIGRLRRTLPPDPCATRSTRRHKR